MLKQCKVCGQEFDADKSTRQFCTQQCCGKAKRGNPNGNAGRPRATRVRCECRGCGKAFEVTPNAVARGRDRYCGQVCYHASRAGKPRGSYGRTKAFGVPRVDPEERTCPACKKTFLVGGRGHASKKQVLCSMVCQRMSRFRTSGIVHDLSVSDAAYLAGFLDGEGSVIIYQRPGKSYGIHILLTNTCRAVLEWAKRMTGVGTITDHNKGTDRTQPSWIWRCSAGAAERVLVQLSPHLKVKARQAALALEFRAKLRDPAFKADRSWQAEARQQMKDLNARGKRAVELAGEREKQ